MDSKDALGNGGRADEAFLLVGELKVALVHARDALRLLELEGDPVRGGRAALRAHLERMDGLLARVAEIVSRGGPRSRLPMASVLDELQAAAMPERNVRVVLDVDETVVVRGDELLLTSALGNLVQNALKFTRTDGEVTLRCRAVEGGRVAIEVEDQCGGLPTGDVERLLEPFMQGKAHPAGIGLGLTMARRAAHVHGGELHVRNRPGRGCVFGMTLPRIVETD